MLEDWYRIRRTERQRFKTQDDTARGLDLHSLDLVSAFPLLYSNPPGLQLSSTRSSGPGASFLLSSRFTPRRLFIVS